MNGYVPAGYPVQPPRPSASFGMCQPRPALLCSACVRSQAAKPDCDCTYVRSPADMHHPRQYPSHVVTATSFNPGFAPVARWSGLTRANVTSTQEPR